MIRSYALIKSGYIFQYGRTYTIQTGSYRFGFNTQEKVDEVSGDGNHNTAMFWEYDTRLGRRWNVDPKGEDYPWQSPYSVFNNNPVSFVDEEGLEGDDPNPVVGKNKNTGKDVRQKTDVSKLKLNLRAKVINIVVIGTGKAKNDADPTTGWKASDKTDENTVALYVDNAGDLDKMLKQIRTQYGKEVGNIIFVSHGDPNNSMFFIGSTVINDAKDLDFLKDDLSKKSIIMATACHTGSPKIGGAEFLKSISQRLGVVAIGNQGWTAFGAGPDDDLTSNATYGSHPSRNFAWAAQNDKWFTIAVPKLGKNKSVTLYQGQDVRISKSGIIYLKSSKIQKLKTNGKK